MLSERQGCFAEDNEKIVWYARNSHLYRTVSSSKTISFLGEELGHDVISSREMLFDSLSQIGRTIRHVKQNIFQSSEYLKNFKCILMICLTGVRPTLKSVISSMYT